MVAGRALAALVSKDVVGFICATFAAKFVRLAPSWGILSQETVEGTVGLDRFRLFRVVGDDVNNRAEVLVIL